MRISFEFINRGTLTFIKSWTDKLLKLFLQTSFKMLKNLLEPQIPVVQKVNHLKKPLHPFQTRMSRKCTHPTSDYITQLSSELWSDVVNRSDYIKVSEVSLVLYGNIVNVSCEYLINHSLIQMFQDFYQKLMISSLTTW